MNPVRHSLAILWLRLRWEIAAFAVTVILSCAALLAGIDSRWLTAFARIETLLLFWLTLRIVLADDGFKTTAGWRTRPVPWGAQFAGQLLLLVLVLLPAVLFHALVVLRLFQPTPDQWSALLRATVLDTSFSWLLLVATLKLFATILLSQLEGGARKAAWSVLVILLVPVLGLVLPKGKGARQRESGGSGEAPGELAQGIERLLPDATEFLGQWNESLRDTGEVPRARLLARFPINAAGHAGAPGVLVEGIRVSQHHTRTSITVSLQALDDDLIGQLRGNPIAILRFSNGMYGTCFRHTVGTSPSPSPFLSTRGYHFSGTFISPRCLPEKRNAGPQEFAPTDLLFFGPDPNKPLLPISLDRAGFGYDDIPPAPPLTIPSPSIGARFALAVRQLIDSLSSKEEPAEPALVQALVATLPRAAIDPILAYHPWPDRAWDEMIRPFLAQHATASHQPALLRRLAVDPRLTSVFIENGWSADAVPILRQRAAQRLPLPPDALILLAAENETALAADLAALAIRHQRGIEDIAPRLRESAGFDWVSFVSNGWKDRKYGNYDHEGWVYARWAAELGDRSALRRLAEQAASGSKWEHERLAALIPGAPPELIPFLRKHFADLAYDPATQTWRLQM